MTTLDQLNKVLDSEPWTTLSAIADFYEETGDALMGAAYRWFVENGRFPRKTYAETSFWIGRDSLANAEALPNAVLNWLREHAKEHEWLHPSDYYPTQSDAYLWAAKALAGLAKEGSGPLVGP